MLDVRPIMEVLAAVGLILLPVLFLVILWLVFYYLRKVPSVGKTLSLVYLGWLAYLTYTAIWPLDSFYVDEIERYTSLQLPSDHKVLKKRSSYPDIHGDYYSEAVIKVKGLDTSNIGRSEKQYGCMVTEFAKPFLNKTDAMECWYIQHDKSERLNIIYFREKGLLYFRYVQL